MSKTQSIWDEVDEMPQDFEEKSALSVSFLKRALEGLLVEGRKENVLTPPYGRPDQPTPLLNLKSFLKSGGLVESTDDKPVFSYTYGFDPLQYLADYLKFLHPNSICAMKNNRRAAIERLQFRAAHGRTVLNSFEKLKDLTDQIRSGILWGPFTSPSTSTQSTLNSVVCACRVVREGDLIVEISKDSQFTVIENSWTQIVRDKAMTQKIFLSDLEPGLKYYIRCCLRDTFIPLSPPKIGIDNSREQIPSINRVEIDTRLFRGPEEGFFKNAQFIAIPSDEVIDMDQLELESSPLSANTLVDPVRIIALNISSAAHLPLHSIETVTYATKGCFISCLLGEIFPRPSESQTANVVTHASSSLIKGKQKSNRNLSQNFVDHSDWYDKQNFHLHRYSNLFVASDSVLRNSSMLLAWHDRSVDSDISLNEEEMNVKQFAIDMKKYKSKYNISRNNSANYQSKHESIPAPPRMKERKMTGELAAVLQALPLDLDAGEKSPEGGQPSQLPLIPQLYSTSMLGPHVQLFVLDYRRGYLGKDQILWLTDSLVNSTARFKIILSGSPFGASTNSLDLIEKMDQLNRDLHTEQQQTLSEDVDALLKPLEGVSFASEIDNAADPSVADAKSQTRDRPNSVAVQIPPPVEGDGWDKEGRLKLTLASVIAEYQNVYIQRRIEEEKNIQREKDSMTSSRGSRRHSQSSSSGHGNVNLPLPIEIESEEIHEKLPNFVQSESNSSPLSFEYELESGIIIISSGACVPISKEKPPPTEPETSRFSGKSSRKITPVVGSDFITDAVAKAVDVIDESDISRINDKNSIVVPYAATFDPNKTGRLFCFELCIGGGAGLDSGSESALPPVKLPYLGTQLIYTFPNGINHNEDIKKSDIKSTEGSDSDSGIDPRSCSAVVTLSDDACSLDLQLLGLNDSIPSVLFQCKIRIPV